MHYVVNDRGGGGGGHTTSARAPMTLALTSTHVAWMTRGARHLIHPLPQGDLVCPAVRPRTSPSPPPPGECLRPASR
jgi:hypothetical protein